MQRYNWITALIADESGVIISAELVFILTILVIGLVTGMVAVQEAVDSELTDVASAIGSLNQSYHYTGFSSLKRECGALKSFTTGSHFIDSRDEEARLRQGCDLPAVGIEPDCATPGSVAPECAPPHTSPRHVPTAPPVLKGPHLRSEPKSVTPRASVETVGYVPPHVSSMTPAGPECDPCAPSVSREVVVGPVAPARPTFVPTEIFRRQAAGAFVQRNTRCGADRR